MGLVSSAACCAAEGACCCGTTLLQCCCRAGGGGKGPSSKLAKVFYLFMVILSTILALIMRAYGDQMFVHFYSFKFGCDGGADSRCFGDQSVYRFSFALAIFFVFMLLGSVSRSFHRGYWGLKFALYAVLTAASFFIPNEFFNVYSQISRVVSIVFLLLMIIILVEFAHHLQSIYMEHVEAQPEGVEGCCSKKADIVYATVCFIMIIGAFIGIVFMYKFAADNQCSGQIGFLTVTLLVGVVLIIMSVLDVFTPKDADPPGLITPGTVFVYATWLMWSAMTSEDDPTCNPFGADSDQPWYVTFIGIVITGLSLAYTSYSAASSLPSLCGGDDEEEESLTSPLTGGTSGSGAGQRDLDGVLTGSIKNERDLEAAREQRADDDGSDAGDDSDDDAGNRRSMAISSRGETGPPEKPWQFHVIMLAASLYMAMLLTNWGVGTSNGTSTDGAASMWIKIVTQWLTYMLYFWTLIAPLCCKNRDFS